VCVLMASVAVDAQSLFIFAVADVLEELLVCENTSSGLAIEQNPVRLYHVGLACECDFVTLVEREMDVVVIVALFILDHLFLDGALDWFPRVPDDGRRMHIWRCPMPGRFSSDSQI
jgi:hypothetical protein